MISLSFKAITDLTDSLLCDWLDLYETAFPPQERILISGYIRRLQTRVYPVKYPEEMIAALNAEKRLVGLAFYGWQQDVNCLMLWYLAVISGQRSQGFGSQIYQEIVRQARSENYDGILFEVEIPENAQTPQTKIQSERRIRFYQQNGAKLLTGIHYLQSVGTHQPLTPMHLMFHPLNDLDDQDVFNRAKRIFGDLLTKTGALALA